MTDTSPSNDPITTDNPQQQDQVSAVDGAGSDGQVGASASAAEAPSGGDGVGSEDEVDGLMGVSEAGGANSEPDTGDKENTTKTAASETAVTSSTTNNESEPVVDTVPSQDEPSPSVPVTEDSLKQHNDAVEATRPSESTSAPITAAAALSTKEALPSSFARVPSPAGSATSSTTPASAPIAPKKFSSVNVNKKFLSKAASPGPGPTGSAAGGSPGGGSPAAVAAKPLGGLSGLGGRPIASPLPQSSSSARLLTAKLTSVSASTKSSPTLAPLATLGRTGSDQGRASSPGSLILGKRPGLVSTTMQSQQQPRPPPAAKKVWGPVPAAVPAQVGRSGMGSSRDFPTTREVIEGEKKAIEHAQAAAQAQAAHNQAILQQLDAFRGANRDPNGHYWDEDDDEGSEVIDFGDGQTYTIHTNPTEAPPPEVENAPVSKAERFGGDDFDRSWPSRARPAAPQSASAEEAARVLFNAQSNRLEPSSYARASGSQQQSAHPQRIIARQPPPHSNAPRRPSNSGGAFERPLPPHLADRGLSSHAQPEPSRMDRSRDTQTGAAGRRPSWGTAMRSDADRPLHPVGRLDSARAPLPTPKSPPLQHRTPEQLPRKSFSQILQPAVPRPEATPAPAQVPEAQPTSPQAASGEVPAATPVAPAVNITELQKTEMHTAAERARLRRLAEEEEREAKAERARQKAKELEDRMTAAAAAKAAAAAPAPAPAPTPPVKEQPKPAPAPPPVKLPTAILARKPSPASLLPATRPSTSPQGATAKAAEPSPHQNSTPPPASANLPKKPAPSSQPVFPGANVVYETGLWQGRKEGVEEKNVETDTDSVEVLDFADLSKLAPGAAATSNPQVETQRRPAPPPVATRSARDEWRRAPPAQRELPPHQVTQAGPSSNNAALTAKTKTSEVERSASDAPKPRKESNFEDTLARLKAVMMKADTTANAAPVPTVRPPPAAGAAKPVDPVVMPKPAVPTDPPQLFDVTQLLLAPLPPPAWNRYIVSLPKASGNGKLPIAGWRLKAFETPLRTPTKQWSLSWTPACEGLNLATLMREDVFLPRRWIRGSYPPPRVRLPPTPGTVASAKPASTSPAESSADGSAPAESSTTPMVTTSPTMPTNAIRQVREFKPRAFDDASWRRKGDTQEGPVASVPPPAGAKSHTAQAEMANIALASALAAGPYGDDLTSSKQGVRFMVSSELEGDSLLDEVNKMSLETVGEGSPDGRFGEPSQATAGAEDVSVSGETPKTPPTTSGTSSRGHASSPTSTAPTPWSKSSISYTTSSQSPARGNNAQHDHLKSVWSQPSQASAPQENSLRGVMDDYPTGLQFNAQDLPADQPQEVSAEDTQSPMYPSIHASSSNDNLMNQGVSNGYGPQGAMYGSPLASHPSMNSPHVFVPRPASGNGPVQSYGYLGGVGPSSSTSPIMHHNLSHGYDSRYGRSNAVGQGNMLGNIISNTSGLTGLNTAPHGVWTTLPVGSAVPSPTWNHAYAPKATGQMVQQNVAAMHAFGSVGKDDPRGYSPHQAPAQVYAQQGGYRGQSPQEAAFGRSPVPANAYAYASYGQGYGGPDQARGPSARPSGYSSNPNGGDYGANRGYEAAPGYRGPSSQASYGYQQGAAGQAGRGAGPAGQSRRPW